MDYPVLVNPGKPLKGAMKKKTRATAPRPAKTRKTAGAKRNAVPKRAKLVKAHAAAPLLSAAPDDAKPAVRRLRTQAEAPRAAVWGGQQRHLNTVDGRRGDLDARRRATVRVRRRDSPRPIGTRPRNHRRVGARPQRGDRDQHPGRHHRRDQHGDQHRARRRCRLVRHIPERKRSRRACTSMLSG